MLVQACPLLAYTRVDIAVAVRAAAQKVIALTQADWLAVKKIFLYLANNPDLGISYRAGAQTSIVASSNISRADYLENRRSIGAYAVLVADGVSRGAVSSRRLLSFPLPSRNDCSLGHHHKGHLMMQIVRQARLSPARTDNHS